MADAGLLRRAGARGSPDVVGTLPSPADIFGADTVLYLDGESASLVDDGTGKASSWADDGPAGNDVAQGTSANRPTIITSSGHRGIGSDGAALRWLHRSGNTFTGLSVGDHPFVSIVVEWTGTDGQGANSLEINDAALGDGIGCYHTAGGNLTGRVWLQGAAGTAATSWAGHTPPTAIELVQFWVTDAGASSRVSLAVDGTVQNTTGAGSQGDGLNLALDNLYIFANVEAMRGNAFTYTITNRLPTVGELTSLNAFYSDRYGLTGVAAL